MNRNSLLVVLTGSPDLGKNLMCASLVRRYRRGLNAVRMVSSTTRAPHKGEQDGFAYYFLTHDEFEKQSRRDEFLEESRYLGERYGTNRRVLEEFSADSRLVVTSINTDGCLQLQERGVVALILPLVLDSMEVLEKRIRRRAEARTDDYVEKRLRAAREENRVVLSGAFGRPIFTRDGCVHETMGVLQERIDEALAGLQNAGAFLAKQ